MSKQPETTFDGVLCMMKPQDFTSFDVIAKLRGMTRTRKIGHSGTLDPMATGVLPVFFGTAAKACDLVPCQDKRYRAELLFGRTTDTQDIWGKTLTETPSAVSRGELTALLPSFRGEIAQLPPMYSAIQIGGQRLYDLARRGIEVKRQTRVITVHSLELLGFDGERQTALIDVCCSKGTYIRTLCHDLGQKLGCGAVMSALTRTEAAGFTLEDCVTFEEVSARLLEGRFQETLLPVGRIFDSLPSLRLNSVQERMFSNGVRLDLTRVRHTQSGIHAVYGSENTFLGLADCREETAELVLQKLFAKRS